jgi:class 3 adenylate cyclase
MIAFVSGSHHAGQRDLATVLFTDVVDSTGSVVAVGDGEWRQTLDFLDDIVASRASRAGGRVVKQTGDGHLVEFARPGDAVAAALAICRDAPTLGVQVRAGVHTGEIERRESGDIGGLSVHIAARVAANTNSKASLVAGSCSPSAPESATTRQRCPRTRVPISRAWGVTDRRGGGPFS